MRKDIAWPAGTADPWRYPCTGGASGARFFTFIMVNIMIFSACAVSPSGIEEQVRTDYAPRFHTHAGVQHSPGAIS